MMANQADMYNRGAGPLLWFSSRNELPIACTCLRKNDICTHRQSHGWRDWHTGARRRLPARCFCFPGAVPCHDLLGAQTNPNRLFLQQEDGTFVDRTGGDLADPGMAFGTAVGDINGDGLLDIVQSDPFGGRSLVLLNRGDGSFTDVLDAAGLGVLATVGVLSVGLGDVDNDGDLDLLTGAPHFLFLNDGTGSFACATDVSGLMPEPGNGVLAFGDLNNDGFLDVVTGGIPAEILDYTPWSVFLNNGNANHWLRVELIGVQSNGQR